MVGNANAASRLRLALRYTESVRHSPKMKELQTLTAPHACAPTQAAEFSGPGKHAIVLYTPDWTGAVLAVLRAKPASYEASWHFQVEHRSHVLEIAYEGGPTVHVTLVDGIHNAILAKLARGCALVLSPYPLYRDYEDQVVEHLFSPEESVVLPELPSPLG